MSAAKRRAIFYLSLLAMLALCRTDGLRLLLGLVLGDAEAKQWAATAYRGAQDLLLLLVLSGYLDVVRRKADREETEARDRQAEEGRRAEIEELGRQFAAAAEVSEQAASSMVAQVKDAVATVTAMQQGRVLDTLSARELLSALLRRELGRHEESFDSLVSSVLGYDGGPKFYDTDVDLVLTDHPGDIDYYTQRRVLRADIRLDAYTIAVTTSQQLYDELVLRGDVTDTWIVSDEFTFEETKRLVRDACISRLGRDDASGATIRTRLDVAEVTDVDRFFGKSTNGEVFLVTAAVPRPAGSELVRLEVDTSVVLEKSIGINFFVVDSPTYLRRIAFDVRDFMRTEAAEMGLFLFVGTTTDCPSNLGSRCQTYEAVVDNWLVRGHGAALVWNRHGTGSMVRSPAPELIGSN